jgi:hypothetical protein
MTWADAVRVALAGYWLFAGLRCRRLLWPIDPMMGVAALLACVAFAIDAFVDPLFWEPSE